MNANGFADTFDVSVYLTGFVTLFWLVGEAIKGSLSRKWRRVKKYRRTY